METYYTLSGTSVNMATEIGRGGEGRILTIEGDPDLAAKVYHKEPSPEQRDKILAMVKNPPKDPTINGPTRHVSIVWPKDALFMDRRQRRFAGFLMPRIQSKSFIKMITYISPNDRLATFLGAFTWRHLVVTAFNLSSCTAAIHQRGHFIGDVNESNFLVSPMATLAVIDCDSFQIKDPANNRLWRCNVGKPEYTAPEISNASFKDVDRTKETDNFALAVLIFQLLMEGTHPYSAKGPLVENAPTVRDKIIKGFFPYKNNGQRRKNGVDPPDYAPPFGILHPDIQALFLRCFDSGHGTPSLRPSAIEWMAALNKLYYNEIKECRSNANHCYSAHLSACPWCERAKSSGRDSFDSPVGQQIFISGSQKDILSDDKKIQYLKSLIQFALVDNVMTADEEEFIISQGLKIQLSKTTISNLIRDEIYKNSQSKSKKSPLQTIFQSNAPSVTAASTPPRKQIIQTTASQSATQFSGYAITGTASPPLQYPMSPQPAAQSSSQAGVAAAHPVRSFVNGALFVMLFVVVPFIFFLERCSS